MESRAAAWAPWLVLALTLAAWGRVPLGAFQFDDFRNVVGDRATTDTVELIRRLPYGLRPLTRLSYFLDAHIFGMRAWGFLTVNLLLHLITTWLVWLLARRRFGTMAALIAALVFALQPANGEVVAYISGRSTALMAPLLLAGLLLYDRGRLALALMFFGLACLARESALVFPGLVWLWDLSRGRQSRIAAPAWIGAAVVAATVAGCLLAFENYRILAASSLALRSLLDNVLANGRAVPEMLSLWLRPWALSADHGFDVGGSPVAGAVGVALLVSAFVAAVARHRRAPLLVLAVAWPLMALAPTNSVIPKPDLVTERALYLAWVGPALAIGAGLAACFACVHGNIARRAAYAAAAAAIVVAVAVCNWRAWVWADPTRLWQDATAKAPDNSRCWNNLGMAHFSAGRDLDAIVAFQTALRLDPHNDRARVNLWRTALLCGDRCPAAMTNDLAMP